MHTFAQWSGFRDIVSRLRLPRWTLSAQSRNSTAQPGNFITLSPASSYSGGLPGHDSSDEQKGFEPSSASGSPRWPPSAQGKNSLAPAYYGTYLSAPIPPTRDNLDGIEYPYRAKAIYSYEQNPDDANELGFEKYEILEVANVKGRWWQAKKTNGETGIVPSHYLNLLKMS
ncbi:Transmembrane osmosensor [Epicoccum nigrum]|nr:Transmembrane osmosensor [Epicoccum nigrum]